MTRPRLRSDIIDKWMGDAIAWWRVVKDAPGPGAAVDPVTSCTQRLAYLRGFAWPRSYDEDDVDTLTAAWLLGLHGASQWP